MINLWKNCHDSLVFLVIADEWWLINNLSLTRVIILCCLLFLNMASSCFHYGSSSSSLFLDNASWLHQDLFDPFFWGLTWLYLVLLTNPRTAEKCGHLEWFPLPTIIPVTSHWGHHKSSRCMNLKQIKKVVHHDASCIVSNWNHRKECAEPQHLRISSSPGLPCKWQSKAPSSSSHLW